MRMRRTLVLLIITIMLLGTTAYANDTTYINLEQSNQRIINDVVGDLVYGVINNDTSYLDSIYSSFSNDCYNKFRDYTQNNDINSSGVAEAVIDFTYPNNSTTGDTVIMSNVKLTYNEHKYNTLYLFEFHVNKDGRIYGYNVWAY